MKNMVHIIVIATIIVATVVITLSLTGCITDKDSGPGDIVQVGDKLPEFEALMYDGTIIKTSSLAGATSLIIFFDTTCKDCRATLPEVERLYREIGIGAGDGSTEETRFVGISRGEDAETVAAYWAENDLTIPFSATGDRKIYDRFASNVVPRVYISDAELTVHAIFTDNPNPTYDDLRSALEAIE